MNPNEPTLESWKEIAAYLQRDAKTARKWEKEEGLPIHRHSHKSRSSVYAYASEIDAWRVGRTSRSDVGSGDPTYRWPALAVTLALCLVMVGNGIRPQTASAAEPANRRCGRFRMAAISSGPSPAMGDTYPTPIGSHSGICSCTIW